LAVIAVGGCAASSEVPPPIPASVGPLIIREQPDSGGPAFLGSAACRACHAAAFDRWRATRHARDFAGLLAADRLLSACLRCHVTGYGDRLGYRATEGQDLANVGCEACHGPGAGHGRSAHPELVPTRTGGECPPCEINRICRLCHTPERSPGFELEQALMKIDCKP
jgi:hypothetical protein